MDKYIRQKSFNQLKTFIESCLDGTEPVNEEDREYLTTDRRSLLEMVERLSQLADQEIKDIKPPSFDPWTSLISIDSDKSKKQKVILEKFQTLDHRRYSAYLLDKAEFNKLVADLNEEFKNRHKIIADIFARIESCTKDQLKQQTTKLTWKLLPSSAEDRFSGIVNHYRQLEEHTPQIRYEIDRLYKVYELNADQIYVGTDEFEGYVVFYFTRSQSAVLECPVAGNAIYIFQKNWQTLSQLSKASLLGNWN